MQIFFIFFVVVLIIIGFSVVSQLQAQKRRDELQQCAASHGLSFSAEKDPAMDDRYPLFPCLHEGDHRYAFNIMQGTGANRQVLAFDYHYETHSTDSKGNRTTYSHVFSAVIIDSGLPLQSLSIRSETFMDKVSAFMGFEDINFESAEFNRQFYVTSPDRRWAFDVLNQQSMEFLLASPRFCLEMGNGSVIAFRKEKLSPGDIEAALGVIEGLLDRIPPSVLNELKGAN